jgi:hypothetical protein
MRQQWPKQCLKPFKLADRPIWLVDYLKDLRQWLAHQHWEQFPPKKAVKESNGIMI